MSPRGGGGAMRHAGVVAVPVALAVAVALAAALAGTARAQDERTARLDPPTCDGLSFSHDRLRDLLAVELSVHRVTLVDGDADDVVRYGPVRCGDGGSAIRVVLERRGVIAARVQIAHEPPRALALYLAELMREPFDDPVADLLAGRVSAAELLPTPPRAAASLADPARRRGSSWTVAPRRAPPPDDDHGSKYLGDAPLVAVGVLAEMLYNPENEAWLTGPRASLSLRMPFDRHVRLSLDAGVSIGGSSWGIRLGTASVGFEATLAAGDRDFYIEVGPRLASFYGWAVDQPNDQIWQEQETMFTLGATIRGVARVDAGLSFVLALEASAPIASRIAFGSTERRDRPGGGLDVAFFVLRLGLLID